VGANTEISWTGTILPDGTMIPGHTWNGWWGCHKISPGCQHCYAESFSKRVGKDIWGPAKTTERWRTTGPWKDILKWDREAARVGVRRRVFAQSMSDFFEDHPQLPEWREEAFPILENLQWLDVLLLTKRIDNVVTMVPPSWMWRWPAHIWMGTSVEDQEWADKRIPLLLNIPATIRFLSCEPLLGPINILQYTMPRFAADDPRHYPWRNGVEWVIVGGESGHGARPMHPKWAQDIRDQALNAGIPFHFKQHGEHISRSQLTNMQVAVLPDSVYANAKPMAGEQVFRVGKKEAGHLLDGQEWHQFPTTQQGPAR
jgi:protein gp37